MFPRFTALFADDDASLAGPALAIGTKSFRAIKLFVSHANDTMRPHFERILAICENHCLHRIAHIELITPQGNIDTVYFPIPSDFRKRAFSIVIFVCLLFVMQ